MMQEHAAEILQLTFWLIGALGGLILMLFGVGLAVVRWAIHRYEQGQAEAQASLNRRLDTQDSTLNSIRDFISKELYELREWFHRLDKDVISLKSRIENRRHGDEPDAK
jgi:uncharacterized membrane-anchored protein YhcB (DUF1043 family)